jgi:hypothetical protein
MSISTQETYVPTQRETMTQTQIEKTLQTIADGFRVWPRSPILHWPDEEGLAYEDVTFPSQDGVPLEGWFIPASGSNKIIIANHPRWFNRSGLLSHLEPWKSLGGATGNDFEVNFVRTTRSSTMLATTCSRMTCATSATVVRPTTASLP